MASDEEVKRVASEHIRNSATEILRSIASQLPPGYVATLIVISPQGETYAASNARNEAVPFILREAAAQVEKGQVTH